MLEIGSSSFPYVYEVLDDGIDESAEAFNLILSVPSGIGNASVDTLTNIFTVTIMDDDCKSWGGIGVLANCINNGQKPSSCILQQISCRMSLLYAFWLFFFVFINDGCPCCREL